MDRRSVLIGGVGLALGAGSSVLAQQSGQKRFALILANQTYEKNPLPNIRNDALLMDKTLKSIGFTTTVVLDGTRTSMLDGIRRFKSGLTPGAFVLLYYSGHGAQVDGENYLIPTDNGQLDDAEAAKDQCIPLGGPNGLLEKLGRSPGQLNLIILDACRDDPFPAATKSQGSKGLAVVSRPVSGDYIAMAASPGQTASANPKGMNSLYTQELVQRLATPGLRLEDVFIETRNAVVAASGGKQVPQEFGTLTAKVFLAGGAANNPSSNNNPEIKLSATAIRLELIGVPSGAKVLIDDAVLSGTVYTDEIAERTKEVEVSVSAAGFRPYVGKVNLIRGSSSTLRITLDRVAQAESAVTSNSGQQPGQKRFAVILANQTYEKNPLPNIDNDASLMAKTLTGLGFTVTTLMNGTRSTMRTKLKELKDNLTVNPGGIGFVYYSGHGVQVDGENYLVPVNNGTLASEADVEEDCLSLSYVLDVSKGTQAKAYITVLDASSDNPFSERSKDRSKVLEPSARVVGENQLVALAASDGESASAGIGTSSSLYTAELATQLQTPNLTLLEVFQKTASAIRVKSANKQNPRVVSEVRDVIYLSGNGGLQPKLSLPHETEYKATSVARFLSAAGKIRDKYPRLADYVESLCVIPAGDFLMGSSKDNEASPLHKVSLSSFGMGATPVTVGLWNEYATSKLGGHMPPQDIFSGFTDTRKFNIGWKELDHPIVSVSWEDCRKFCMWASEVSGVSLDLPSEAQWEFACRGGVSGQEFPWGSLYDDSKVWSTFVYQRKSTAPVNRSDNIYRNRFGLADMVGNVQVWCLDWYDPQWYGRAQASGSDIVNTSSAPAIYRNNLDQKAFAFRCVRGASWDSSHPSNCFCTARDRKNPVRCSNSVGFRLSARLS